MAAANRAKNAYELVVQDDFLVVLHPLEPLSLHISRCSPTDASLGLRVEHVKDFQHVHGRRMVFDAIYGVFWLLRGPYLAAVTQSKLVARGVEDAEIRVVQKLELLLIPTQHLPVLTLLQEQDERTFIDMLTGDIEAQQLHFSNDCDLTHTLQRTTRCLCAWKKRYCEHHLWTPNGTDDVFVCLVVWLLMSLVICAAMGLCFCWCRRCIVRWQAPHDC